MLAHVVLAFFRGATWMEMKDGYGFAPSHGGRKYRHLAGLEVIFAANHWAGRQAAFGNLNSVPVILDKFDESSVRFFFHHGAPLVGFFAHTHLSVVIFDTDF